MVPCLAASGAFGGSRFLGMAYNLITDATLIKTGLAKRELASGLLCELASVVHAHLADLVRL